MPRKATASVVQEHDTDLGRVSSDLKAADQHHAHLVVVDSTYGTHDGEVVPYQRDRVIQEIRFYLSTSAQAMLEAGKRLVQMKEHEPHGDWMACLQRIGVDHSVAKRMMQAAIKFAPANGATSHHLIEAAGNKSKLIELLVLDEGQIKELDEGGTVANLTLDDIERMSTSELRAALREARENEEAQGRVLQEKNAKLDDLASKLNKTKKQIKALPPDELAAGILREATTIGFDCEAVVRTQVRPAIEALMQHGLAHGGDFTGFCSGMLAQIQRAIDELRVEFDIPVEPVAAQAQEWAGQGKAQ